ncbi:MAG: DUF3617 family protein [Proteobacteria bacterium]|nr:DUF3617 family protein [Pseudomonadota bacterium]
MHIRFAIAASVVFAASAAQASPAEFPARRAGLWNVTVNMESAKLPAHTNKMCIDAATDAKLMKLGVASKEADCTSMKVSGSGSVRIVDSVCHFNGGTQKNHVEIAYAGDSAYHMDMQSQFSPAIAGKTRSHIVQDAKWAGPCPAGMKPGDMMINGMKINMLGPIGRPAPGPGGKPYGHLTQEQIQAIIKAHGGH